MKNNGNLRQGCGGFSSFAAPVPARQRTGVKRSPEAAWPPALHLAGGGAQLFKLKHYFFSVLS